MTKLALTYFTQALQQLPHFSIPQIGSFTRQYISRDGQVTGTYTIIFNPDDSLATDVFEQWLMQMDNLPAGEAVTMAERIGQGLLVELEAGDSIRVSGYGELRFANSGLLHFTSSIIQEGPASGPPTAAQAGSRQQATAQAAAPPATTPAAHSPGMGPEATAAAHSTPMAETPDSAKGTAERYRARNTNPAYMIILLLLGGALMVGMFFAAETLIVQKNKLAALEAQTQEGRVDVSVEDLPDSLSAARQQREDDLAPLPKEAQDAPKDQNNEAQNEAKAPEAPKEAKAPDAAKPDKRDAKRDVVASARVVYHVVVARGLELAAAEETRQLWLQKGFAAQLLRTRDARKFDVSLLSTGNEDEAVARAEGINNLHQTQCMVLGLRFVD